MRPAKEERADERQAMENVTSAVPMFPKESALVEQCLLKSFDGAGTGETWDACARASPRRYCSTKDGKFAESLGLGGLPLVAWADLGVKPMATPAIVLVDSKGVILKYWLGELTGRTRHQVLEAVLSPESVQNEPRKLPGGQRMISEGEIMTAALSGSATVININERVQFRGMQYSYLSHEHPIVMSCCTGPRWSWIVQKPK